ncbi:hypothetical protein D0X99_00555 [Algoriphagus lacus]|uniref:Uncharacterized protein n=1 Tax=Algoriphagus lacus TaxID=2056311 RepID=A0A418PVX4_9BACT|nr:hypothetical protein [Algoriphagus lacus]RIW18225.1 hypothetical protein D0X99_00555 [Algoriphagus lacus]
MKIQRLMLSGLLLWAAFSCVSSEGEKKLEKLPYFDLSGFIDLEISKLDGAQVTKTSRINGEEKIVDTTYSITDWKEEMEAFYQADINTPSLALSYSTETKFEYLIHKLLPEAKGKVKEIKVSYYKNYPSSVTFKMSDENMFFSTVTMGEFFMSQSTNKLDHYSIETTQKVWFLKPTNIKISGIVK